MTEPKIILSLLVPGANLLTPEVCENNPKESYNHFTIRVNKDSKGKKQTTIHVTTRKNSTVKQNIKLTREAYDYMVGNFTDTKLRKVWKTLSINEKIKEHCKIIAETLGAVDFSFEILND